MGSSWGEHRGPTRTTWGGLVPEASLLAAPGSYAERCAPLSFTGRIALASINGRGSLARLPTESALRAADRWRATLPAPFLPIPSEDLP